MHGIADDPQYRLHKGSEASIQSGEQVGLTLPAGPDAACTALFNPTKTGSSTGSFFGCVEPRDPISIATRAKDRHIENLSGAGSGFTA
jgi:hypothetical protein